jgi:uncharacterized protein (DUF2252 family)
VLTTETTTAATKKAPAAKVPPPRAATEDLAAHRATPEERRKAGRQLRKTVPLEAHAQCPPAGGARDPLGLLLEQDADRLQELVPYRHGRMAASPFAFYRGAARVMAADLAATPRSGLTVQMCGDAHISNFGFYGSPERRLVFDANDFDETLPGPFEFDVKRLVASLAVAARENGLSPKRRRALLLSAGARYRTAMREFAGARDIDVWYSRADAEELQKELAPRLARGQRKRLASALAAARTRDSVQAFGKLTEVVEGRPVIRSQPPLLVPIRELLPELEGRELADSFHDLIRQYRGSLQSDRRALLERYSFVDMARKVVGVGSVGTRCWVVLLSGRDADDPLLLQIKEAGRSVHASFVGRSRYVNQGQRVVAGQRLMQQTSDIFLGWQRTTGIDGVTRDFYVRQLRDWKGSVVIGDLRPPGLQLYGEQCAWCLARAHARSGDRMAIAGYLGASPDFEHAVAEFAEAYADLTEADHARLSEAVESGAVAAAREV